MDLNEKRSASVRRREEQTQEMLAQRSKLLAQIRSRTANGETKSGESASQRWIVVQRRAAERNKRQRALSARAAERDAKRREDVRYDPLASGVTLVTLRVYLNFCGRIRLERKKRRQERNARLSALREAKVEEREHMRNQVTIARAYRVMERDPIYRALRRG